MKILKNCLMLAVICSASQLWAHVFSSFDGDSAADFIVSVKSGANGQVTWCEYNPGGSMLSRDVYSYSAQTFDTVSLGDLDNDQYQDLLVGGSYGIKWYEARSNNTSTLVTSWGSSGYYVKDIKFFNRTAYISRSGYVYKLTSTANNAATLTTLINNAARTYTFVCPCDFDLDGNTEVMVGWYLNSNPNSGQIDLYEDGASFTFISTLRSEPGGYEAIAGHFDEDAAIDLFVSRTNAAGILWYEASGTNNGLTLKSTIQNRAAKHLLLTDVDQDGYADLIMSADNAGDQQTNWIEATGDDTFAWRTAFNQYHISGCLTAGDWDADMYTDIWFGSKPSVYGVQWSEGNGTDNGRTDKGEFIAQYEASGAVFSGNPKSFYAQDWDIAACPRVIDEGSMLAPFVLNASTVIYYQNTADANYAQVLQEFITNAFNLTPSLTTTEPIGNAISLKRNTGLSRTGQYLLNVGASAKCSIQGKDQDGVRSGVGTLMRILGDSRLKLRGSGLIVPAVDINDYPSITGWRGLNIQMCFAQQSDVNSVKRLIQSVFQTHLNTLIFDIGHNWDANCVGANGIYSKQQIRDMVQYAKKRGFCVIPGINMLAHGERSPLWYSYVDNNNGINMTDSRNYALIDQILDEVKYDFGSPQYFHAGMDEALNTVQANAVSLGKTEKQTVLDHINAVNTKVRSRNMQMIIYHDMLVNSTEVSEVANGTAAPNGTAGARADVPDNVIINVWDYCNNGGAGCVQLFKDVANPVVNSGWMHYSVSESAKVTVDKAILGMVSTTWANVELTENSTSTAVNVFWTYEQLARVPAYTAHYCWYYPSETYSVYNTPFDAALGTTLDRYNRLGRSAPTTVSAIDLSGLTGYRNTGDSCLGLISAMKSKSPVKGTNVYLKGMPFKVAVDKYVEVQSVFDGNFPLQDRQTSAQYVHHAKIKRNGTVIEEFNITKINAGRGTNDLVMYAPPNIRTGTNAWGREVVIENGRVTGLCELGETGNSRIPKNGYVLSAHGTAINNIDTVVLGDTVIMTRVYSDHTEDAFVINKRTSAASGIADITVNSSNIAKITFLHSCPFGTSLGEQIGTYRVNYTDSTQQDIPVVFGKNIGAMGCATGMYDRVTADNMWLAFANYGFKDANNISSVYAFEWVNPYTAKTISNIKMVPFKLRLAKRIIGATPTPTFDAIAVGNLDGDGYKDLIVGGSDGIRWYESRSNNSTTLVNYFLRDGYNIHDIQFYGNRVYIGCDGQVVLLTSSGNDIVTSTVLINDATKKFYTVCPSDYDNDGYEEVLVGWETVGSPGSGQTDIYEYRSPNLNWKSTLLSTYSGGYKTIAGNFDGDSYIDIFASRIGAAGLFWYEATGADNAITYVATIQNRTAKHMVLKDIDGDGYSELLMSVLNNGEQTNWIEANGNNAFVWRSTLNEYNSSGMLAAGDFEGNGLVDFWYGSKPGQFGIQHGEGTGVNNLWINTGEYSSEGNGGDAVFVSDFDGDSCPDLLFTDNLSSYKTINWHEYDPAAGTVETGWTLFGINVQ